jgi:hypothetical protein
MQAPICRVCGMRHWGGDHVFPGSAKAKPPQQAGKPANQAALSVPTHGERSLAPRESPSVTGTNGEDHPIERLPDAIAVGALELLPASEAPPVDDDMAAYCITDSRTGEVTVCIPEDMPLQKQQAILDKLATKYGIDFSEATDQEQAPSPAVSLFDDEDDVVETLAPVGKPTTKPDAPPPKGKTDRKTYMREYIKARRQREREDKQRAADAGTGATDQ